MINLVECLFLDQGTEILKVGIILFDMWLERVISPMLAIFLIMITTVGLSSVFIVFHIVILEIKV